MVVVVQPSKLSNTRACPSLQRSIVNLNLHECAFLTTPMNCNDKAKTPLRTSRNALHYQCSAPLPEVRSKCASRFFSDVAERAQLNRLHNITGSTSARLRSSDKCCGHQNIDALTRYIADVQDGCPRFQRKTSARRGTDVHSIPYGYDPVLDIGSENHSDHSRLSTA